MTVVVRDGVAVVVPVTVKPAVPEPVERADIEAVMVPVWDTEAVLEPVVVIDVVFVTSAEGVCVRVSDTEEVAV